MANLLPQERNRLATGVSSTVPVLPKLSKKGLTQVELFTLQVFWMLMSANHHNDVGILFWKHDDAAFYQLSVTGLPSSSSNEKQHHRRVCAAGTQSFRSGCTNGLISHSVVLVTKSECNRTIDIVYCSDTWNDTWPQLLVPLPRSDSRLFPP